jgi:hypothetical protein
MLATIAWVVYDAASAELRRIIHPDNDRQDFRSHLMPGEALTSIPRHDRGFHPPDQHELDRARQAVVRATGRFPIGG